MKTLHVNVKKLSPNETIRYSGPTSGGHHGVYALCLFHNVPQDDPKCIEIIMSLEALMQLRTRIDAAMQHMITH